MTGKDVTKAEAARLHAKFVEASRDLYTLRNGWNASTFRSTILYSGSYFVAQQASQPR